MKTTTYTIKALCMTALLGSAVAVHAQEDQTKEKELNRQMTLEREYDPTVQDANKVNTLPEVKEPEVTKRAIDYATFTLPIDPEKEISLLPSGNVMTDIQYNKRRGYFNFGGGTHLNLNGDIGYHILSTDRDKLNIWFSHRSTNGNVKYIQEVEPEHEKVKAKINDNLGGIGFSHLFRRATLDLGARYGYSAYNYYGLPFSSSSTLDFDLADRDTRQVDQTIQGYVGVRKTPSHWGLTSLPRSTVTSASVLRLTPAISTIPCPRKNPTPREQATRPTPSPPTRTTSTASSIPITGSEGRTGTSSWVPS